MALVAYSDSEGSDTETQPRIIAKATPKPTPNQTNAGFAFNKSNPRKLQVNLASSVVTPSHRNEDGEPVPKRAKSERSGLGGFNAALPAPKRETEKKSTLNASTRKVFSLKTGAEPAFSREADAELSQLFAEQTSAPQTILTNQSMYNREDNSEPSKMGNPMQFRPLSVARNTKKRSGTPAQSKKAAASIQLTTSYAPTSSVAAAPAPKPKVSLFSAGVDIISVIPDKMGYDGEDLDKETGLQNQDTEVTPAIPVDNHDGSLAAPPHPQSLDTIASDLNLSAADRRRLFGREGKGSNSAVNIVNFNTDQEYAANEALRTSGEQVQHHAVRGIAPGKHSLKQLVNAATTQKNALEESFAAGKSNKREAGSRYGW